MSKAAAIGDKTSILGFKVLGLDIYPFAGVQEVAGIWEKIKGKDYSIIFVTEQAFKEIEKEVKEVQEITPAVIIIPETTGSMGFAHYRIKKMVEKAIGIDIISKEGEG